MAGDRTVVIIQARLGSSRLPGKVLMDIAGRPMLRRVVDRVRAASSVDRVLVATTGLPKDDLLAAWCRDNEVECFRGSEADVLDRYCRAARAAEAETVVRITSDCPLIDPAVIDRAVTALRGNPGADGAVSVLRRTFPRGLDTEAVRYATLERLWKTARDARYREHVTLYMYEHPAEFSLVSVEHDEDLSALRWTVDVEEDLALVREIYARLDGRDLFGMEEVLALFREDPSLVRINADVRQKTV